MYNSKQTVKYQGYSQQNPRYYCRNEKAFLELSLEKGYELKCRDPRCSFDCAYNHANKQGTCLARHLDNIKSSGKKIFRGHLRMPQDASPSSHREAKARFLRLINTWRKQNNYVIEIYAYRHITDNKNAHWDIVAYSDAPTKTIRRIIAESWSSSGSLMDSLIIMSDDELKRQSRYITHDTKKKQINHLLPVNRDQD